MRSAPSAVQTGLLATNIAVRADLYTVTLLDGTVYRWTTSDLTIIVGGNTFTANSAVLSRGHIRQSARDNHRHRVVEVGLPHFLHDLPRLYFPYVSHGIAVSAK